MAGGINHVILCTDGDFNVGPSSDDELVALIEEKRQTGITLTVLGFGSGNLNDSMMEKVSNAGNGIYAVISSESHADRFVEDRMLATIEHVAKDMKIQVEFNPEVVTAYRLLGYENRAIADDDFRDDSVDAGEVGSGHRVTALYELILNGGEVPDIEGAPAVEDGEAVSGEREIAPEDMVLVKVRYKDVGASEQDPAREVTATMTPKEITSSLEGAEENFQWAAAVATLAEILKESPYAEQSALTEIEGIVAAKEWLDADRAEFKELFLKTVPLLTN
jgi:Ca-activated chloride channel family protein